MEIFGRHQSLLIDGGQYSKRLKRQGTGKRQRGAFKAYLAENARKAWEPCLEIKTRGEKMSLIHWKFYRCGKKRNLPAWKFNFPTHWTKKLYYIQYHNRVHIEIGVMLKNKKKELKG